MCSDFPDVWNTYGDAATFLRRCTARASAIILASASALSARLFSMTTLVYLVFVRSSTFPPTTIRHTCAVRLAMSTSSHCNAIISPVRIPL